jgi:hypothetical protein
MNLVESAAGRACGDVFSFLDRLCGGKDVVVIDADAERFVAAVFSDGIGEIGAVLQE